MSVANEGIYARRDGDLAHAWNDATDGSLCGAVASGAVPVGSQIRPWDDNVTCPGCLSLMSAANRQDSLQGCRESDRIAEGLSTSGKPRFTRRLRNQPMTITYDVIHPSELGAGLRGYEEIVTVTVDSGDPGGSPNEFAEEMQKFLAEWFDGAAVGIRPTKLPVKTYPVARGGKIVYVTIPED